MELPCTFVDFRENSKELPSMIKVFSEKDRGSDEERVSLIFSGSSLDLPKKFQRRLMEL